VRVWIFLQTSFVQVCAKHVFILQTNIPINTLGAQILQNFREQVTHNQLLLSNTHEEIQVLKNQTQLNLNQKLNQKIPESQPLVQQFVELRDHLQHNNLLINQENNHPI
jgi:hypothetical protein